MWERFKASFHSSETLVWARIQMVGGAILIAATQTDLSPFLSNPKVLAGYVMINGFLSEILRRSNTVVADDGHLHGVRASDDSDS